MTCAFAVTATETQYALILVHELLRDDALISLLALGDDNAADLGFLKQVIDVPVGLLVCPEMMGQP